MGTRSVVTFSGDQNTAFSVYVHWDSYPDGMADMLVSAFAKSWPLPRFEADEFAASFVAANKTGAGTVRLTTGPDAHGDLAYVYEVFTSGRNGQVCIRAKIVGGDEIFYGRLKDFVKEYGAVSTKKKWNELDPSPNKLLLDDAKVKAAAKAAALSKLTAAEKTLLGLV